MQRVARGDVDIGQRLLARLRPPPGSLRLLAPGRIQYASRCWRRIVADPTAAGTRIGADDRAVPRHSAGFGERSDGPKLN